MPRPPRAIQWLFCPRGHHLRLYRTRHGVLVACTVCVKTGQAGSPTL